MPKRKSVQNMPKPSLRTAVKLAKAKDKLEGIVSRVEDDFCANSSRAARNSKRRTVSEVLHAGEAGSH